MKKSVKVASAKPQSAKDFNNITVSHPKNLLRMYFLASDEHEVLLIIDNCRKPNLVVAKDAVPIEIIEGYWSCLCELKKGG